MLATIPCEEQWVVEKVMYLRQLFRWHIIIHHAHLVRERVADDEAEGYECRRDEKVVGPVEPLVQSKHARPDACSNEQVRKGEEYPFCNLTHSIPVLAVPFHSIVSSTSFLFFRVVG